EVLIQVSYAIGKVEPTSILVDTNQSANVDLTDSEISKVVTDIFDMTPAAIEERLQLRNPIYSETAAYGHMGRTPKTVIKKFKCRFNGEIEKEVTLFSWEKLDYVDKIRSAFSL